MSEGGALDRWVLPWPELRQRVRVAADTVASPELRETLLELAERDDETARLAALRRAASSG